MEWLWVWLCACTCGIYVLYDLSLCRPRADDRMPSGPASNNYVGVGEMMEPGEMGEVVGEGSSDEDGDEEEPIYDQPDEGDEDFNE